ncbi:hypothetical protein [Haloprofundus salilacus]|uniref:hypothetical protein n=1 Tax=Haloprofundus salilacus TaxID=2876190 RepID=UPI001CCB5472|nr:hypothetical protein [Haloprofundus salilacus]
MELPEDYFKFRMVFAGVVGILILVGLVVSSVVTGPAGYALTLAITGIIVGGVYWHLKK